MLDLRRSTRRGSCRRTCSADHHQLASARSHRDGTHPSALREIDVDVDKDVKVNVKGYPACTSGQLTRATRAPRRKSAAKRPRRRSAHVEIAFPEQPPIPVASPLPSSTAAKRAASDVLIHTFITVPVRPRSSPT